MNDPSTRPGARLSRSPGRYRLAMSPLVRGLRVAVLLAAGLLFVAFALGTGVDPLWRAFGVAGLVSVGVSLRAVVGPAVVVDADGLCVVRVWPLRRVIPWYRILEVEVVPVAWVLHIELNSGEHIELPVVEDLDLLYREVEERRHQLDG